MFGFHKYHKCAGIPFSNIGGQFSGQLAFYYRIQYHLGTYPAMGLPGSYRKSLFSQFFRYTSVLAINYDLHSPITKGQTLLDQTAHDHTQGKPQAKMISFTGSFKDPTTMPRATV